MRKELIIENPELFNLPDPINTRIIKLIQKTKRTTAGIVSKELKCPHSVALWNLNRLAVNGEIKDLGKFKVNGRHTRIFEL